MLQEQEAGVDLVSQTLATPHPTHLYMLQE